MDRILEHNKKAGNNDEDNIEKCVLLMDITGSEDHHGDMDFKIAGTEEGITAIQLDVKLEGGVPVEILSNAVHLGITGIRHITENMDACLAKPRSELKETAPYAKVVKYDEARKANLIGQGGEMLRFIRDESGCEVILDEICSKVYIFGKDKKSVAIAASTVTDIAIKVKEGIVVTAEVAEVKEYGAIMKLNRAQEGLLHISEMSHDKAISKKQMSDLVKVGQKN